jgi:protein-L-isoaspartate O-methyltransferase
MNATIQETPETFPGLSATYSPDDNKLRLYSVRRLDPELYARVKAAGFAWAPKQELFVAPMWTPARADLLIELCGSIDDEDTSLVERAEQRADRFEDYGEARASDADAAHAAVARIADGIPMGQPILIGHHSERHARRDAKRIENGMRRAVHLWETSKYWADRAKGALRHAKYKELPGVRHRRIKGLEADKRKHGRTIKEAEHYAKLWRAEGLTREKAIAIANYDHVSLPPKPGQEYGGSLWSALTDVTEDAITVKAAAAHALGVHERQIAHAQRWIDHLENRLAYERAMLDESGGIKADAFPIEVGGRVCDRIGSRWYVVKKINRVDGAITSVSVLGHYAGGLNIEDITDYRAPEAGDAEKVKAATKLAPIVNYPGEGFVHMTSAEWKKWTKATDCAQLYRHKATETHGAYRQREKYAGGGKTVGVFLTDAKVVERPATKPAAPVVFEPVLAEPAPRAAPRSAPEPTKFDALKESLKGGVRVVQADQLFPTPDALVARMIDLADIRPEHRVLEPSAGTGAIVRALQKIGVTHMRFVEINAALASTTGARCADFLACTDLGTFDRVVMNPPFADGQDVAHVLHAFTMLNPGGRLVAVMSAGVTFRSDRKTKAFRALVETFGTMEELPVKTFDRAGTGVQTVLVTLVKS